MPLVMRQKIPRLDRWVVLPLVCLYAFTVQFGNLFRFAAEESALGISTIIAIFIILFGLGRIIRTIRRERCYLAIGTLLLWAAVPSLVVMSEDPLAAGRSWAEVAGYMMLSAAIADSHVVDGARVVRLWLSIAVGVLISAGLTIIDYIGLVDVPYNNESKILTEFGALRVEQAGGFFLRRSAMAAIFSVSIAGLAVMAYLDTRYLNRMIYAVSAFVGIVCLLLTHNRSGILSVGLALYCFALFSHRLSMARKTKTFLGVSMLLVAVMGVMYAYFPEHTDVYLELSRSISGTDYGRVLLFKYAVASALDNPIGHGFTPMEVSNFPVTNPHNLITGIIWATGVFSFVWIPWFATIMFGYVKRFRSQQYETSQVSFVDATAIGLLAWLLNNMTHYSLGVGLAWVLLGILIANARRTRLRAVKRPKTTSSPIPSPAGR